MDIEATKQRLFERLDKIYEGEPVKRNIPIKQFSADEIDLDAIRKVAGNADLSSDEVFDFPKFIIARSGRNHNRTEVTGDGQKAAVNEWVGKPVYFEDHKTEARNQIGRIYQAWTEDKDGETVTYGKAYGIKTDTDADLQSKIKNRIHQEMSCGYEVLKSVCSVCGTDVMKTDCVEHGATQDYYAKDIEFKPDHISFVGRPGIEGAGLVTNNRNVDTVCDDSDQTEHLQRLAEDGEYFREYVSDCFTKWYQMNNPTSTTEDVTTLCDKLSSKEMLTFARIERDKVIDEMPDGKQQTVATQADETQTADLADRPYKTVKDIFKNRS